jgi:hypothetical protein
MSRLTPAQVMARIAVGNVKSTLLNCHKPGLHSIVLEDRVDENVGMTRVFYSTADHTLGTLMTGGDFSLLPHNHRQDIKLELLWGEVDNLILQKDSGGAGLPAHKYYFSSAIVDDEIGVSYSGDFPFSVTRTNRIGPGPQSLLLKAETFHTVVVKSKTAAWVVYEEQTSKVPSMCLSLSPNLKLSQEGLDIPGDITDIKEQFLNDAQ